MLVHSLFLCLDRSGRIVVRRLPSRVLSPPSRCRSLCARPAKNQRSAVGSTRPTIQVKPESRMHDPFSADHPPLPPDDPSSAKFMQLVDDKRGYSHWHANGDTDYVESPDWMSYLPVDANGQVIIDSTRAVTLALTHSTCVPDGSAKNSYLSALDVSLSDSVLIRNCSLDSTRSGGIREDFAVGARPLEYHRGILHQDEPN